MGQVFGFPKPLANFLDDMGNLNDAWVTSGCDIVKKTYK